MLQMKYLSVPVTSVPSKCVFSKVGQITNDRKHSLHTKTLDCIIFLKSNINIEFYYKVNLISKLSFNLYILNCKAGYFKL